MKNRLCLIALVFIFGAVSSASALPITFNGSSGELAATATFDVSGTDLLVSLANVSAADPRSPGAILSGVIFSINNNQLLTRTSAALSTGSIVIHGPTPSTDPVYSVGGEWAYSNSLTGPYLGQSAIYSSGYFNGNARFPGSNLQGPGSVAGVQYGLTTLFDLPGNDNGGIRNIGLIKNSMDFILGGLSAGFDLNSISNVSFQYGTDLDETNIPSSPGDNPVAPVPEPGTIALLGFGLSGLVFCRRRTAKS